MDLLERGGEQVSFQNCVKVNKNEKCITKVREVPRRLNRVSEKENYLAHLYVESKKINEQTNRNRLVSGCQRRGGGGVGRNR